MYVTETAIMNAANLGSTLLAASDAYVATVGFATFQARGFPFKAELRLVCQTCGGWFSQWLQVERRLLRMLPPGWSRSVGPVIHDPSTCDGITNTWALPSWPHDGTHGGAAFLRLSPLT